MNTQQALQEGGQAAFLLLKLTAASSEAFPPLRGVASGALYIVETVMKFKSNKKAWAEFGQYVTDATACVIKALPDSSETREDLKSNIEKLRDSLVRIQQNIQSVQDEAGVQRVWSFLKDPERIADMRKEFDDVLSLFHLTFTLTTGLDVAKILDGVNMEQLLQRVQGNLGDKLVTTVATNNALNALPCADGASWDPSRTCLPGTREGHLDDVRSWVKSIDVENTKKIFWLTGVAGAGKTAIAHTVAQLCYQDGLLASSFFFDRNVADRNETKKLLSTIARGLANFNAGVADQISHTIELDQSVATAPMARQFEELIRKPSIWLPGHKPVVIVIDGLDEGYNDDLLSILCDMIPTLPSVFRIFLTSRPEDEIVAALSRKEHIRSANIDIYGQANLKDISIYIQDRLQDIAYRKDLPAGWPGEQRIKEFTEKAGGLFVWVYTVSRYLRKATHPDKKLASLLSKRSDSALPAEEKIDQLYATILDACDWSDEDFVEGYGLFFGAILAAKTPLSLSAVQSLHRTSTTLQASEVLGVLGSLLTGLNNRSQPVQILHISLREFLNYRARLSPGRERFSLSETEHSQRLALLCLITLNQDLKQAMPGTGYLSIPVSYPLSDADEIPNIAPSLISEELWYSCRFWMDHIVDVKVPTLTLINELRSFLSAKIIVWVEVTTSKGRFPRQDQLQKWLQETLPDEADVTTAVADPDLARSLQNLSLRLSNVGRREEAMEAAQQAVQLFRPLAESCPAVFNPDLAKSLHTHSMCLAQLARRDGALESIQQAVELRRKLAADHPAAFNRDLARSINILSVRLGEVGRSKDALELIQQAVELRRQLAAVCPATFKPELAESLNNLAIYLFDVGRLEDSLEPIQQAIELRRQGPTAYKPNLANSLGNLAVCLCKLGRRDEALQSMQQSAELRRQLAADRPTVFTPALPGSLHNLAWALGHVGRREDALGVEEEAVELLRQLAADRPAEFNQLFAQSTVGLAKHLSSVGRREDALESMQQAIELYQPLVVGHPTVFNPIFANALELLSKCHYRLGRREDALQAIQQAVTLSRQLAAAGPAFEPDLAHHLISLSMCLADLGHREDALESIQEAVGFFRQLAAGLPAAFNPDFAAALHNLSKCLSDLGRREEALESIQQAVKLRQQLAADYPAVFNPDLATSLNHLSLCLANLGHREEALPLVQDAVKLCRQLAAGCPAAFNEHLADCLHNLSKRFSDLGRHEDALESIQQAVELRRQLAADFPAAFNHDLAMSLDALSRCLSILGRRKDSLEPIQQAVKLLQGLVADHPAMFKQDHCASLSHLSNCLSELGYEDTLEVNQERNTS